MKGHYALKRARRGLQKTERMTPLKLTAITMRVGAAFMMVAALTACS